MIADLIAWLLHLFGIGRSVSTTVHADGAVDPNYVREVLSFYTVRDLRDIVRAMEVKPKSFLKSDMIDALVEAGQK